MYTCIYIHIYTYIYTYTLYMPIYRLIEFKLIVDVSTFLDVFVYVQRGPPHLHLIVHLLHQLCRIVAAASPRQQQEGQNGPSVVLSTPRAVPPVPHHCILTKNNKNKKCWICLQSIRNTR